VNKKNHEYLILWDNVKKYVTMHMVHYLSHIKVSTASAQNALFWKIIFMQQQDEGFPLNLSLKFQMKPRHAYPDLSLKFQIKKRHAYPDLSLKFWTKPRHAHPEHCEGNP
jgi:hypothetical protein